MAARIIILLLILSSLTYGADSTVTVCASGCDYTSIESALDANEMDIESVLGDGFNFFIEVDSTIDTDQATVGGYTTDINNFIWITAASGAEHGGVFNENVYIYKSFRFDVGELYTIIEKIQINQDWTGGTNAGVQFQGAASPAHGSILRYCIIIKTGSATSGQQGVDIRQSGSTTDTIYIHTNLFDGFNSQSTSRGINCFTGSTGLAFIYSNTFINCRTAIFVSSGVPVVKNNIMWGCENPSSADALNSTEQSDYNATDSSAFAYSNGGPNDSTSATFSFADSGNDDFQLTAEFLGADLSGDSFLPITTDINGVSIEPGSPDAGAFEFIAAVGDEINSRRRKTMLERIRQ